MTITHTTGPHSPRRGRLARGQGRAALLSATQQMIVVDGIEGVRLRPVAEVAGLSLGSTTYHFPDRADMIADALANHTQAIEQSCAAPAAGDGHGPGAVEEVLVEIYADRNRAVVTAELRTHAMRNTDTRELARRIHGAQHTLLTEVGGVAFRRAQRIITDLDAAVIDLAGEHHQPGPYDRAMRRRIADVMSAR